MANPIKNHLIVCLNTTAEYAEGLMAELNRVAAMYKRTLLSVYITTDSLNVASQIGISAADVPTAVMLDMSGKKLKKFRLVDNVPESEVKPVDSSDSGKEGEELDVEAAEHKAHYPVLDAGVLDTLAADFFDGSLSHHVRSEPEPEPSKEKGLQVAVGTTFRSMTISSEHDTLMAFVAAPQYCQSFCKNLAGKLEELAAVTDRATLSILEMDAAENDIDHPDIVVRNVPALYLFPANDLENPIKFDGDAGRTSVENIREFIVTHAHFLLPEVADAEEEQELADIHARKFPSEVPAPAAGGDDVHTEL
jgi:hypothetical protein